MVLAVVLLAGATGLAWVSGLSSEEPPEETVREQASTMISGSVEAESGEPPDAGGGAPAPQEDKGAAEAAPEAAGSERPPEAELDEPAAESVPRELNEAERTAAVLALYEPAFEDLKQAADGEVDALIAEAKAAYYAVEEADRTMAFKLELANTYLKRGNALEETFDERFYILLDEMRSALQSEGLDETAADEVEAAYVTEKRNRRKALLDKAMEKI